MKVMKKWLLNLLEGLAVNDIEAYSLPEHRETELDLEFYKLSATEDDNFSDEQCSDYILLNNRTALHSEA